MTIKKKTSQLFDYHRLDELGVPVKNLVTDSRQIKPGDTFLAYAGDITDGQKFIDRKSTRLNSSHVKRSRMPSSA